MQRVLVLVPLALDEAGVANRRAQLQSARLGPGIEFDFRAVKAGPAMFDSYHDWVLADIGLFEAGLDAEREGYDAVCIDTMSDSGVDALRSVLSIPVIGPAKASFHIALTLGNKFGVVTQWKRWISETVKVIAQYGLTDKCASIRCVDVKPDLENLLQGKEDELFPLLLVAAEQCVEDGADVICLASTTMHEAHGYLSERLDVPVINPGPLTYRLAELVLGLGLRQSPTAYQSPEVPKLDMIKAMLTTAAEYEARGATIPDQ